MLDPAETPASLLPQTLLPTRRCSTESSQRRVPSRRTASMDTMPYMYILECADGTYYVGSTWNIGRRLSQHNAGEGAEYTRTRRPVALLYVEEHYMIKDAFAREKQVQG